MREVYPSEKGTFTLFGKCAATFTSVSAPISPPQRSDCVRMSEDKPDGFPCPFPGCEEASRDSSHMVSRIRSHLNSDHVGFRPPEAWLDSTSSWICGGKNCGAVLSSVHSKCHVCKVRRGFNPTCSTHRRNSDHDPKRETNKIESIPLGSSMEVSRQGLPPAGAKAKAEPVPKPTTESKPWALQIHGDA